MSSSGAVTLGDIADKITTLEVACSRCERLSQSTSTARTRSLSGR
jgi:hypothetical protein